MKKIYFYLLIIFSITITSCTEFKEVTLSGVEGVKVTSLSQQGIEALITVKIKNPNKFSFTVYKSEMDVTANGINLGKAYISENVKIKRNSEELYTFKIKSGFSQMSMMQLPKLLSIAASKTLQLNIKGNLKGGKLFVKRSFPVDVTENVPLGGI